MKRSWKNSKNLVSIKGINWQNKKPDKYGDWINQRDDSFYQFLPVGDKKSGNQNAIFSLYSRGVQTARDSWAYNFNKNQIKKNIGKYDKFL